MMSRGKPTFKDSITLPLSFILTGVTSSHSEAHVAIDLCAGRLILNKKIALTITHFFLSSSYKNATCHQWCTCCYMLLNLNYNSTGPPSDKSNKPSIWIDSGLNGSHLFVFFSVVVIQCVLCLLVLLLLVGLLCTLVVMWNKDSPMSGIRR